MGWLVWAAIYLVVYAYMSTSQARKTELLNLLWRWAALLVAWVKGFVLSPSPGGGLAGFGADSSTYMASPRRGGPRPGVDSNGLASSSKQGDDIYRGTPRSARSTSRHGFDDVDLEEDDEKGDDGISPLTQQTWKSSCSKHGFYDDDDETREDLHYHSDRSASKGASGKASGNLFPASPDVSTRGAQGEDISPLSNASYSSLRRRMIRRRVIKDVDSVLSDNKENSMSFVTRQMLELYSNTNSLALDLLRRDELREKDLQQAADRREILFETNSQTQQSLMRKYEEEENRIETDRKNKVSEIHGMLRKDTSSLDVRRLFDLLKEARTYSLPLAASDMSEMEKLYVACGTCVDEAKRLYGLAHGNDMVEKETFSELEMVLESPLSRRMIAAGNESLRKAKELVDENNRQKALEEEVAAKERDRLEAERVVLPPNIPKLDNLLAEVKAESFLENKANAALLDIGSQLCEVMATSQVPLKKEQRYLLWSTVFEALVGSAVAMKAEVDVLKFTVVIFGIFAAMKKGHKKYGPGCYRMLHGVLVELSPVLVPKLTILRAEPATGEISKFLRSREARLRTATLYGSIIAIEVETNTSVADSWVWLARLTKYLRRAVSMLAQNKATVGDVEYLKADIVESCRGIRNFLRLGGPLLLLKYRTAILSRSDGLLPSLASIAKDALALPGVSNTADTKTHDGKIFTAGSSLLKLVEGTVSSGVFDSVPFHPVCHLSAQMAEAYTLTMKKKVKETRTGANYKAQERVRNSIPHRLLRVPGLLTKEGKVELVKQLIVDISQQEPQLLSCGLSTVAGEIVKKCTDDQFIHTNLANPLEIATIITDLCASKLGSSFGNLIKNEFNIECPMTVPRLDTTIKQERMQKVICTFALCCVQDGNAFSLVDAWEWLANMTNLASREASVHRDIAEALNTFLRVVSERMLQAFGKPFKQVVLALGDRVLPLVEESVERKRLKEFLEKFKNGQIAPIFMDN